MSSNVVYLDLDSTFRNRTNFPSQFDFSVPLQQSNRSTEAINAADPISDAVPVNLDFVTGTSTDTTHIQLDTNDVAVENYYVGQYLEVEGYLDVDGGTPTITAYDSTTFVATITPAFTAVPPSGTSYYTRVQLPLYTGDVVASLTNSSFYAAENLPQNYFTNSFVRFLPTSSVGSNALAFPLPVISYNATTGLVKVQGNFPSVPQVGDAFELDAFTIDNFSPLTSIRGVSQQINLSGKIEVELVYLCLPNVYLSSNYHGALENYPYVYVSLYNDGYSNARQIMFSNSPYTEQVIFKVPINDYAEVRSFLTLKDCKMKQKFALRLDQNLHITISDPSGNVLATQEIDTSSPARPMPLLQMSALFCIRLS